MLPKALYKCFICGNSSNCNLGKVIKYNIIINQIMMFMLSENKLPYLIVNLFYV